MSMHEVARCSVCGEKVEMCAYCNSVIWSQWDDEAKKRKGNENIKCVWFMAENIYGYYLHFHNKKCLDAWQKWQNEKKIKDAKILTFVRKEEPIEFPYKEM